MRDVTASKILISEAVGGICYPFLHQTARFAWTNLILPEWSQLIMAFKKQKSEAHPYQNKWVSLKRRLLRSIRLNWNQPGEFLRARNIRVPFPVQGASVCPRKKHRKNKMLVQRTARSINVAQYYRKRKLKKCRQHPLKSGHQEDVPFQSLPTLKNKIMVSAVNFFLTISDRSLIWKHCTGCLAQPTL